MNVAIGSKRDVEKPRISGWSAQDIDRDKDRLRSLPSGQAQKDALLRELFVFVSNWAERFYRGRKDRDKQKVIESILREILPDSRLPLPSIVSLPGRVHEFMMDRLHQGLTLKELSEFLGYSKKHCSNFFILHMGEPFSVYLKELRLQTAKRLLESSEHNLTEIAQAIGFQNQFSFSHFFKRETGMSPRQFRDRFSKSGSQI